MHSIGAAHVLDYRTEDITEHGHQYDLVIDVGGSRPFVTLRRLLAPRGTLVFVGGEGGGRITDDLGRQLRPALVARVTRQRFATFWITRPNAADLDTLTGMIEAGHVTPALDRTWPLADTAEAMRTPNAARCAARSPLPSKTADGRPRSSAHSY